LTMSAYSVQESRIAYRILAVQWAWVDIMSELTSGHRYASEALLIWLKKNSTPQNSRQVISWIASHPNIVATWSESSLRRVAEELEPEVDNHPQALLVIANSLMASKTASKEEAAGYLLRAWAAGASLSPSQLGVLASQLDKLDEGKSRRVLASRQDSSDLMTSLWKINGQITFLPHWWHIFPTKTLSEIPVDVLESMWDSYLAVEEPDRDILPAFIQQFRIKQRLELLLSSVADRRPSLFTYLLDVLWEGEGIKHNREQVIVWITNHPDSVADWPESTIRKVAKQLEPEIDRHPQPLLIFADSLSASGMVRKEEIADFLLRAWAAGDSLSPPQLSLLASQFDKLNEDTSRKRLTDRAGSADLLMALWKANDPPVLSL